MRMIYGGKFFPLILGYSIIRASTIALVLFERLRMISQRREVIASEMLKSAAIPEVASWRKVL